MQNDPKKEAIRVAQDIVNELTKEGFVKNETKVVDTFEDGHPLNYKIVFKDGEEMNVSGKFAYDISSALNEGA